MQKFKTIKLNEDGSITILIFNRDKLNFLNSQMLHEFYIAIKLIRKKIENKTIRGLIVTGNSNGFVPGLDLKEYLSKGNSQLKHYLEMLDEGRKAMRILEKLSVPTVAAVNRFAIGGGLEIALACDFIFADRDAQFGFPEVTLGLIPGAGGTILLKERVGLAKSKEIIFSGKLLNCTDAKKYGLVDVIVKPTQLVKQAKVFLNIILNNAQIPINYAKKSIRMNSYQKEKTLFNQLINSKNTQSLIEAYFQSE